MSQRHFLSSWSAYHIDWPVLKGCQHQNIMLKNILCPPETVSGQYWKGWLLSSRTPALHAQGGPKVNPWHYIVAPSYKIPLPRLLQCKSICVYSEVPLHSVGLNPRQAIYMTTALVYWAIDTKTKLLIAWTFNDQGCMFYCCCHCCFICHCCFMYLTELPHDLTLPTNLSCKK